MEEIKITLETLYDILRNEKKREDLQKLESTFFQDVTSYLREKKTLLNLKREDSELFASGEKEKLESELRNIKRILKEIYEKREKKIIEIALNKSKTGSDLIDTSAMLSEEKEFYQSLLTILDRFRKGILINISKGELPLIAAKTILEEKKEQLKAELETKAELEALDKDKDTLNKFTENVSAESKIENAENKIENKSEQKKEELKKSKIRFTKPMPSFVWKDMKVYGPYDEGEELEIYPEVAELIVRKGRAEMI